MNPESRTRWSQGLWFLGSAAVAWGSYAWLVPVSFQSMPTGSPSVGSLNRSPGDVSGQGGALTGRVSRRIASLEKRAGVGFEALAASGKAGKQLAALMTEYQQVQTDPEAMKAFVPRFKAAFADPEAGIKLARDGLTKLPKLGFGLERMSLLEAAASIPGKKAEAKELAAQELTENVIPSRPSAESAKTEEELNLALSTTHDHNLPQVAAAIVVALADTPEESARTISQSIAVQPEPFVQRQIAQQFLSAHPQARKVLEDELGRRGVEPSKVLPPAGG